MIFFKKKKKQQRPSEVFPQLKNINKKQTKPSLMQNKQTQTSDSFFPPTESIKTHRVPNPKIEKKEKKPNKQTKNKQAFVVRSQGQVGILDLKVGKQSPSSEEE